MSIDEKRFIRTLLVLYNDYNNDLRSRGRYTDVPGTFEGFIAYLAARLSNNLDQ